MTDDVKAVIEKLAVALPKDEVVGFLHTTADKVWEILVWQGRAGAVGHLVECVVPVVLIYVFATKWGPALWEHGRQKENEWEELPWVGLGVGVILTIIGALVLPFMIGDQIVRLINPEYWALKEILDVAKK